MKCGNCTVTKRAIGHCVLGVTLRFSEEENIQRPGQGASAEQAPLLYPISEASRASLAQGSACLNVYPIPYVLYSDFRLGSSLDCMCILV